MHTLQRTCGPILKWMAAFLVVLALVALYVVLRSQAEHDLRSLAPAEQRDLIDRAVATLRGPCAHARGAELTTYCREQAGFIVRLPACHRVCRDAAKDFLPTPQR